MNKEKAPRLNDVGARKSKQTVRAQGDVNHPIANSMALSAASAAERLSCARDARTGSSRAHTEALIERLKALGRACSLTLTTEGDYEYAELTYERPENAPKTAKFGWRVGEVDGESIAYAWLSLELMIAVSE